MQNNTSKKRLTIFTPTYNREKLLPRLYESLKKQSSTRFVWLIIDDGSKDNTSELVNGWKEKREVEIEYFYQENRGKHFAYNRAIKEARTELFIDIDSDDYFLENTVERLISLWDGIPEKEKFSGLMALCQLESGTIVGQKFPSNRFVTNAFEMRYKHSIRGDKAMLYSTRVLKSYSLPEIPRQVVMESILHNRVARDYNSVCFNEPLIVKEYLPDGLSKGSQSSAKKNLDARIILFNEMNHFRLSASQYLYINSRYVKHALLNKEGSVFKKAVNKNALFIFAYIAGYIKYQRSLSA